MTLGSCDGLIFLPILLRTLRVMSGGLGVSSISRLKAVRDPRVQPESASL